MYNSEGQKEYFTEDNNQGIVIFKNKEKISLNNNIFEKESLQKYGGLRYRFKIK